MTIDITIDLARLSARPGYPGRASTATLAEATELAQCARVADATDDDLAREARLESRTVRDSDQDEESTRRDRLVTLRCMVAERILREAGYEDWEVSPAD